METSTSPSPTIATKLDLAPAVALRYSPRSYSPATLSEAEAELLIKAATKAPSSSNSQPWRLIWSLRGEPIFDLITTCLTGNNTIWAPRAAMLLVTIAETQTQEGKPLAYAMHDVGQATAWLSVQAHYMNLHLRQMGGYDRDKLSQALNLPARFQTVAVIAIGYLAPPDALTVDLQAAETKRTTRKPISEVASHGLFQNLE
jgi:nitroreductase